MDDGIQEQGMFKHILMSDIEPMFGLVLRSVSSKLRHLVTGGAMALVLILTSIRADAVSMQIHELYSNTDGSVQFLVLTAGSPVIAGASLVARSSTTSNAKHIFTFPTNLPANAANRFFLVGTQSFADLGLIEPDYVMPDGFLFGASGRVTAGRSRSNLVYPGLPADGVHALWVSGFDPYQVYEDVATALNLAGESYTFNPPPPPPPSPPTIIRQLTELYSNADGSVQFAVYLVNANAGQSLAGLTLLSEGYEVQEFTFPQDLPGDPVGHRFLIATQGFADMHVVDPDYVVPNGFFSVSDGALTILSSDPTEPSYEYTGLPTDGFNALWIYDWGSHAAVATNFAGDEYAFPQPPPPPPPPPPRPPCHSKACKGRD